MYSGKQFTHFICREKRFMHFFVGKTIYALCLESFCALKVAIRKVQTFWASALNIQLRAHLNICLNICSLTSEHGCC